VRHHIRAGVFSMLVVALIAATSLVAPTSASAATRGEIERKLVAKINASRIAHGLRPLQVRDGMRSYARKHSSGMAGRSTLYHTSNFTVICCWRSIGENVAYGYGARSIHRMLMNSPGHRANILSPGKRQVGVGVRIYGGRIWVTEIFRQPW
jgi:uncharacterized protein YkwD